MDTEKKRANSAISILFTLAAALVGMLFSPFATQAAEIAEAQAAEITEAQVFEWWDDGTIGAEEANEMLSLIDEGKMEEVCALAEIYANEPCETGTRAIFGKDEFAGNRTAGDTPAGKKRAGNKTAGKSRVKKPSRHYSGHLAAKVRYDSAGHVTAHREELLFNFHRATLRLGTQELLTYKGNRGEAHFGQISTRELHSGIPLDTLWGTALAYSFGALGLAGLIDTSGTLRAHASYNRSKVFTAGASLWKTTDTYSVMAQAAFPFGQVAYWQQFGERTPLIHFRLHGRDSSAFSWRTTGYIHGDSLPPPARLSPSIAKRRFWTTQNITYRAKKFFDTRVSASARILSPLHSDSVSGRLALDISGGPPALRMGTKFTCVEASENCRQTIFQGTAGTTREFSTLSAMLTGSARTQHDRTEKSWSRPRIEIGASVSEKKSGGREDMFKVTLVAPDASPRENLQIRSETRLTCDFLEFSLIATFKKSDEAKIRPAHAQISSKILF
jgi:hypothetical protein